MIVIKYSFENNSTFSDHFADEILGLILCVALLMRFIDGASIIRLFLLFLESDKITYGFAAKNGN
jgi:hypothetical protein